MVPEQHKAFSDLHEKGGLLAPERSVHCTRSIQRTNIYQTRSGHCWSCCSGIEGSFGTISRVVRSCFGGISNMICVRCGPVGQWSYTFLSISQDHHRRKPLRRSLYSDLPFMIFPFLPHPLIVYLTLLGCFLYFTHTHRYSLRTYIFSHTDQICLRLLSSSPEPLKVWVWLFSKSSSNDTMPESPLSPALIPKT